MMFLAPRGTFPVAGVLFGGRGRVGGRMGRVSARLAPSHHVTVVLDHMLKQNQLNSSSTISYRKYKSFGFFADVFTIGTNNDQRQRANDSYDIMLMNIVVRS